MEIRPSAAHEMAKCEAVAIKTIQCLSVDPDILRITLPEPAPAHSDRRPALESTVHAKDVDGPILPSLETMAYGASEIRWCTTYGGIRLSGAYRVN